MLKLATFDPYLTSTEHRRLLDSNDPTSGRAVATVTPGGRRTTWLASDILTALGARRNVTGGVGTKQNDDWDLVPIWLEAHRIDQLVILQAQRLHLPVLDALLELAAETPTTVVLAPEGPLTSQALKLIDPYEPMPVDGRELLTAPSPAPAEVAAPFPTVPRTDFPTFRADCRATLPADEFAVVDDRYRTALGQASATFDHVEPDGETVMAVYDGLADTCRTTDELLVAARALQAAAFRAGSYVRVDVDTYLVAANTMPTSARRTPQVWRQVAAYPRPWVGAAITATAAGIAPTDIVELTVDQLADDGTSIHHPDGTSTSIDPHAQVYVRALKIQHQRTGASPDAVAFVDTRSRPVTLRAVCDMLATARLELGIPTVHGRVQRRPSPATTRLGRTGLSVTRIV
jgi:hypothetical protein